MRYGTHAGVDRPGMTQATAVAAPQNTENTDMKRRNFLKGLAAVTVVAAGGTVWRAYDQGVFSAGRGPAYEPWINWDIDSGQGPLAIVRAGILASNPHNTQPWAFRVTPDAVELYADTARNLGTFDPYLREMHLGLGCALENMMQAARANGCEVDLRLASGELGPIPADPEPALVARLGLRPGRASADPLYDAIPHRHTDRGPYDAEYSLAPATQRALLAVPGNDEEIRVVLFTEPAVRERFAAMIVEATEDIIADGPMVHDSERWFRHSWAEVQRFRDGPTLDAAGLPPLVTAMAKMLPPASAEANHQYWLDATRDIHVATAPAFGLILVRRLYDRAASLRAGRAWQRMHLGATTLGLAMQPLNQPVERIDRERELAATPKAARALEAFTPNGGWRPTFAFRVGHPTREAAPSPRRSVTQVVMEGSTA